MAYEGGIEYIGIGSAFRWSQISFPSAKSSQAGIGLYMELRKPVRRLNSEDVHEDGQKLTFDGENPDKDNKTWAQELELAIVGRKEQFGGEDRIYVLIVKPCSTSSAYERVGAGYIEESYISDVQKIEKVI